MLSKPNMWFVISCVAVSLICGVLFSGCPSAYRYSYPGNKTFTNQNIARLHVGMPSEDVKAIFGEPDEQYAAEFGADVGKKWNGKVWVYFTKLDRKLKYVKRYKKNIFVFYPAESNMKLNHWEIEE